jgi:hypothetical protein
MRVCDQTEESDERLGREIWLLPASAKGSDGGRGGSSGRFLVCGGGYWGRCIGRLWRVRVRVRVLAIWPHRSSPGEVCGAELINQEALDALKRASHDAARCGQSGSITLLPRQGCGGRAHRAGRALREEAGTRRGASQHLDDFGQSGNVAPKLSEL